MTIKVALEHRTSYTFDRPVRVYPHVVRLRPAPHSRTPIEAYSLRVEPADHFVNWQQDAVGNFISRLTFPNPTNQLTITVGLIADLKVINPFDFFIEDWAETWPSSGVFSYPEPLGDDLKPYLRPVDEDGPGSGPGGLVQAWVRNFSVPPGTRTINFLVELNRRINNDLSYSVRMEHGVQTPDFTLRTGIGSCRDFAWLLVSVAREMGLAARFVSGYLVQLTSDVKALDGPSGPSADFTDLHAWAEVYIPGAGWIGLDPTSGLFAGEGHIPLAATPHPSGAAPITGGIEPCESVLEFSNTVTRIHEDPRVTLPYTDEAWATIQNVAAGVDERLVAADVRLTVGGEPTFVSVDNQVDDEWTTAADGPRGSKRSGPHRAWCTAGRAAGIPENRCRAGRLACTGAPTGSRCGPTAHCSPTPGQSTRPGHRQPSPPPTTCWPPSQTGWACRCRRCGPLTKIRCCGWQPKPACPKVTPSPRMPTWTPKPARTPPRAAPGYWRGSTNPPKRQRHSCCRCIDAKTTTAGPAPTGGFAAAASCWSKVTHRQVFGCHSTRSAGSRLGPPSTPTRPPSATSCIRRRTTQR